jgi:hypothetical protein
LKNKDRRFISQWWWFSKMSKLEKDNSFLNMNSSEFVDNYLRYDKWSYKRYNRK